jgi:alcohol dehydrogenase
MWNFKLPTAILFGGGSIGRLNDLARIYGTRKMLVTDNFLVKLMPFESLIENLGCSGIFTEVEPNPTVKNVDDLAAVLKNQYIEVVIAVGGGSCLDCAKTAACLAKTDRESIRPFHFGKEKFTRPGIPLLAVPTTAGTGSEVTPFAVLNDQVSGSKVPLASEYFYPAQAVVDPELTYSMPLRVTAATALDALSHAIEGYWSKNHQPICDLLAMEAAKKILSNLGKVLDNPSDQTGRYELAYASLIAGMAFQLPKNAIMHACSFPLSTRFHLPHGAACAFTMEGAIRLNAPFMGGRMEVFADYCGFKSIEDLMRAIGGLKKQGGLPCTLREAGIDREQAPALIKESFHPLMNNNPKEVTVEDLNNIYRELGA